MNVNSLNFRHEFHELTRMNFDVKVEFYEFYFLEFKQKGISEN